MDDVRLTVYYDDRENTHSRRWKLCVYKHPIMSTESLGCNTFPEAMEIAKKLVKVRAKWKEGLNEMTGEKYASATVRMETWNKHHK